MQARDKWFRFFFFFFIHRFRFLAADQSSILCFSPLKSHDSHPSFSLSQIQSHQPRNQKKSNRNVMAIKQFLPCEKWVIVLTNVHSWKQPNREENVKRWKSCYERACYPPSPPYTLRSHITSILRPPFLPLQHPYFKIAIHSRPFTSVSRRIKQRLTGPKIWLINEEIKIEIRYPQTQWKGERASPIDFVYNCIYPLLCDWIRISWNCPLMCDRHQWPPHHLL